MVERILTCICTMASFVGENEFTHDEVRFMMWVFGRENIVVGLESIQ